MFHLLSLTTYIKWRVSTSAPEHETRRLKFAATRPISVLWYLSAIFSAVLAMKTKEIAFTLPIIITLYEFMFFEGKIRSRLLYLLPLLLTMLIIPLSMVSVDKPIGELIGDVGEATRLQSTLSRWDYLFTQFRVIVTYIRLIFLPIDQNLDYDYPTYHSFTDPEVFLSFLFLAALFGAGAYLLYRSRRPMQSADAPPRYEFRLIAFGIFWFFITLSVESSIIPISDVIFEHRVYLPAAGFFFAIVNAIVTILHYGEDRKGIVKNKVAVDSFRGLIANGKALHGFLIVACLTTLVVATWHRNRLWSDDVAFFEDLVRKSPGKARAHVALGMAYYNRNMPEYALKAFYRAISLNPDAAEPYGCLGEFYFRNAEFVQSPDIMTKAIEYFQYAAVLNPSDEFTRNYLEKAKRLKAIWTAGHGSKDGGAGGQTR